MSLWYYDLIMMLCVLSSHSTMLRCTMPFETPNPIRRHSKLTSRSHRPWVWHGPCTAPWSCRRLLDWLASKVEAGPWPLSLRSCSYQNFEIVHTCSHSFTFSMLCVPLFYLWTACLYLLKSWSCMELHRFQWVMSSLFVRSQVSAWFRTIAYSSNMFQHLIDIVSILPQGARTRWFWILMSACLCRKCHPACVCLSFAGLTMKRKNSCVCSVSDGFRWTADGRLYQKS